MDNLVMLLTFVGGTVFGVVIGGVVFSNVVTRRLNIFIENLDQALADFAVELTRATMNVNKIPLTTKAPTKPKLEMPPKHIIDMMKRMGELSQEIVELARTLDGPLKNGLDAKYRQGNARRMKQANQEMKDIIEEVLKLGFDPKIMMVDQYGNTVSKKLSELADRLTKGPEELAPFSDGKPNLSFMDEEGGNPPDHSNLS